MKFETLSVHAWKTIESPYREVMTPVYLTSTFGFKQFNRPGPFDYTRSGNPTRKALEDTLAALEGGTRGFAFASGMAAESTILDLWGQGDHIIVHNDLYGGTYRILTKLKAAHGVELDFDPGAHILLMKNEDRPGVIGLLGSNLGAAGINIINFSLGATGDGHALAAITVDREVSQNQLTGLRTIPGIVSLEMF